VTGTSVRAPLSVTLSVWRALFLREAVSRLAASRTAWLWLLLEPVVHVVFLMFLMEVVRLRVIGGIETAVWLMFGMLAYFMFRRTANQTMNALNANQALFVYRQVFPVDTVLVRAGLEGFMMVVITIILLIGASLVGFDVWPEDPLAVVEAFAGMWLVGLGFGLITSVGSALVPELGNMLGLMMTPLYFLSGVIFPLHSVPSPYLEWLMFNPIAHGVEAARIGLSPYYAPVPGVSVAYVFFFAIALLFLGLALHVRFATKLVTR